MSGFETIRLTVKIGTRVLLFGPSEKDVPLVAESCTLFPMSTDVSVQSGDERQVVLRPDAVCLNVENQGTFDVVEIFRRNVTVDPGAAWESIDFDGPLVPSSALSWRLEPGLYEVRLLDECGEESLVAADARVAGDVRYARHVGNEFCFD